MKYINKIAFFVIIAILISCVDDSPLGFDVQKPPSIEVLEHLNQYDALKTYVDRNANPNFKLGAGVSVADYVSQGVMYRLINSNFDEMTAGWEMKHGAVVQADGNLNTANVESFISAAKNTGISIYGHTLCWHANQNAEYLNKKIAPIIIPGQKEPGWDVVTEADFETDNASNYESNTNAIMSFTAVGGGKGGVGRALKILNEEVRAEDHNSQFFVTFAPAMNVGEKYILTMDVRAEASVSFPTQAHVVPYSYKYWDFFGSIAATTEWTTFTKEITITDNTATTAAIAFNLGKNATTYYFDNIKLTKYNENGGSANEGEKWIEAESGTIGSLWNVNDDDLASGMKYVTIQPGNNSTGGPSSNNDGHITYQFNLASGGSYTLWARVAVEVDNGGDDSFYFKIDDGSWVNFNGVAHNTAWEWYSISTSTLSTGQHTLTVSFREDGAKLDKLLLTNTTTTPTGTGSSSSGDIVIEKTPEEKKQIIYSELERWIAGMMEVSKDYVKAWDVVNEPMDDGKPSELKTGVGKTDLKSDEFYWQDYLGKDYAVEAFKLARQHGNQNDILFINDYNLEYNLDKCSGLIAYVEYIESKGARVDGIGTQMHISTNSDKQKIVQMFELLAATGKLIKISELDLGVGKKTSEATDEDYIAQAEMYKFVIQKYFEIIPASQRYGITLWSPVDSPASSSWRAGEPIGVWTELLNRKRAYAGFADGFSGK